MACKKKLNYVMFSLQTKRAIYVTKTPFQLNCKLHGNLTVICFFRRFTDIAGNDKCEKK